MAQRLKGRENSKNLQEKLDSLDKSFWMPKVRIQLGLEFRVGSVNNRATQGIRHVKSSTIKIEEKRDEINQISVSKKGKEKQNEGKGKERISSSPEILSNSTAEPDPDSGSTAEPDLGNSSASDSNKESSTPPDYEAANSKKSPWFEAWKLKHGAVGECSICLERIDGSENVGDEGTELACGVHK